MFPYSAQPFSSIAKANLAAFLSVSGRFASGVQQLTELNIQTVKTVIDESNSLLRAGEVICGSAGFSKTEGTNFAKFSYLLHRHITFYRYHCAYRKSGRHLRKGNWWLYGKRFDQK